MRISIKATNLKLTPALAEYIENKLTSLKKFVKRFEESGEVVVHVEVGKTTRHHQKGQVFRAEVNLPFKKSMFRAVEENEDLRAAIDVVKDKLHIEIGKYKEREIEKRRKMS
jgi:putative sigma-54 modulation protein